METSEQNPSLELARYIRIVRYRWPLPVLGALLGTLAAFSYLMLTPRTFTAETMVNINVVSTQLFSATRPPADLLEPATEAQMTRSSAVTAAVAEALGTTAADVRGAMTSNVLAGTTVLRVTYTSADRDEAVEAADTLATTYLDYRSEVADSKITDMVAELDSRRDELRTQLANSTSGPDGPGPSETDRFLIQTELDAIQREITTLRSIHTDGGDVLTSAADNPVAVAPDRLMVLAAGGLFGVVVGLAMAFLRGTRVRRIRDVYDVRASGGGEVLAVLHGRRAEIPAVGQDLEVLRALREKLLVILPSKRAVLAIADISSGGVNGDAAINVGIALAEAGVQTEVILTERPPAMAELQETLDLKSDSSSTHATRYRSRSYADLALTVAAAPDDTGDGSATYVNRRLTGDTAAGEPAEATIIAFSGTASRSRVLQAGRLGDCVLLVAGVRDTRGVELSALVNQLTGVRSVILGTILRQHRRRLHVSE